MNVIVGTFIGIVIGFIAGWLAFRKKGAQVEAAAASIASTADAIKSDLKKAP